MKKIETPLTWGLAIILMISLFFGNLTTNNDSNIISGDINSNDKISDISDITYSSRYQDATYQEGSLADSSFSHLLDDSSGTFWISKEVKDNNGNLLYEASHPSINDISHSE